MTNKTILISNFEHIATETSRGWSAYSHPGTIRVITVTLPGAAGEKFNLEKSNYKVLEL